MTLSIILLAVATASLPLATTVRVYTLSNRKPFRDLTSNSTDLGLGYYGNVNVKGYACITKEEQSSSNAGAVLQTTRSSQFGP
jgi:hypothetical protein